MSSGTERRDQLIDAVLEKASVDLKFRQTLLDDPKAAIFEEFGISAPEDFQIKFIEKGEELDSLVVLPDFRETPDELTDDELEAVTGGEGGGGGHEPDVSGDSPVLW